VEFLHRIKHYLLSAKNAFMAFWRKKKLRYGLIIGVLLLVYAFSLPRPLFNNPTSTVLVDSEGNLLGAIIADDGQWRFPYSAKVPEKFEKCIIQFEDRNFYRHPGVNPLALGRATWQNISSGHRVSGGSTLTMQVMRIARKNKSRNFLQKLVEIVLSTRLELKYTKAEILALYVSHAPFGSNVVGLEAAAWRYFGRPANKLTWAESAMLAVLPNSPALIYPGKNQQKLLAKRNRLLDRLHKAGEIDSQTCELAKQEPLPGKPFPLPNKAPHLLLRAIKEGHKGEYIKTSLRPALQEWTAEAVDRHIKTLMANGIYNASALVLDVESGNVIAYVGNTDKATVGDHNNAVDVANAPRSTGSILKPLLYCAMLNSGDIAPAALVPDIPTSISGYTPENYNLTYDGAVPAHKALARSLNIPAVKMLQQYGIDKFHYMLKQLGMTTLNNPPSFYGLSLILGGAEGKLYDMAGIYASMARTLNHYNKNKTYYQTDFRKPTFIVTEGEDKKEPSTAKTQYYLTASAIWQTFDAMVEVSRPDEDASWAMFASSRKIAWKTGTSFGNRDGWAIGLTPKYVVAVWVGNADGEGRPNLTGLGAAAPLLFDIFNRLDYAGYFAKPYTDMARVPICRHSGFKASAICSPVDSLWIPKTALRSSACPYHKMVHLDATARWQVIADCEPVDQMVHRPWFVLPPSMEWYFKQKNLFYVPLPTYREDCEKSLTTRKNMDFIYPKGSAKVFVPREIDGKPGRVVFEVAHRKPGAVVYWHLDDNYIGQTTDFHQMACYPSQGFHTLTAVDENGEMVKSAFEAVNK
jgi:penicillin-binding protein 1C